nr:glycosyl transferase [Argonema antarcticum A004/B2]
NFEVEPPENFKRIQSFLAIRERGKKPHLYDPEHLNLPPAAAVVVRKQAWCENVPKRPILSGRVGGQMLGGEDYEPLLYMHKVGWEIWYNPAMHTYHQIPYWRLERDYLISLSRACGLCICHLRMINAKKGQKPIVMTRIFLSNLRRAVRHLRQYRDRVTTDIVAACEMEFFLSCLASPLYFIKTSLFSQLARYIGKNQHTKNLQ